MQLTNYEIHNAGMTIVRFASTARTLVRKNVSSAHATTISKKTGEAIDNWLRKQPEHVIYGSLPSYRQSFQARKPVDLDLAVDNLKEAATEILEIFKKTSKKESRIKQTRYGYCIQVKTNGDWTTAVDIHKLGTYHRKYIHGSTLEPYEKDKLKIQRITDQVLRKADSVMEQRIVKPKRHLKDVVDFINIAKLLIASKEIRQLAKIAKGKNIKTANKILIEAKEAREALKVLEQYARTLKDYGKKHRIKRDTIPAQKKEQFITFAKANPKIPVENLMFTNGSIAKVEPMPKQKKDIFTSGFLGFKNRR